MAHSSSTKSMPVMQGFMPATQSLTIGAFASAWNDLHQLCRNTWYLWLDICDEMSYAMTFYREWGRRHKH